MKLSKLLKRPTPKPDGIRLAKDGSHKLTFPKKGKFTLSKPKPTRTVAQIAEGLDAKAKARQKYREEHGLADNDCRENLDHVEDYAKTYVVTLPSGKTKEWPVIVPTALGEPLGTTGVTITRWLKAGMLPEPVLVTSRGGKAYHLEEVRSFIRILGEHQQQFRQYRKEHTDMTDRLFRENALLRQSIF